MWTTPIVGKIVRSSLLIGGVVLMLQTTASAQRGGFSAEMMLERMDENDNGRLDPDEIAESRFPIASMAERAGIDTSQGLDADDLEQVMSQMREQSSGGFGFGGGDRGGRGGRGGFDRGGSERGSREGDRSSRSAKAPEPPPRVTVDLQATYLAGDSNGDGQIELSEWLRWKSRAALTEFISLDRNVDGILTPRELAQADTAFPVNLATVLPGVNPAALPGARTATPPTNPTMTATPAIPRESPPASPAAAQQPAASPAPAAASADVERHTATAERQFRLLDRDRSGEITDLEWRRSIRLRPKFEAVGADLTQPMSQEQFTALYLKISTAG